jgi:hypothetical protein
MAEIKNTKFKIDETYEIRFCEFGHIQIQLLFLKTEM